MYRLFYLYLLLDYYFLQVQPLWGGSAPTAARWSLGGWGWGCHGIPYCVLLCPFSTSNGWPSGAGPRACPSPICSASARRRRLGNPRCAARALPLCIPGQWARVGSPHLPPSSLPLRMPGPAGSARLSRSLSLYPYRNFPGENQKLSRVETPTDS